MLALTSKNVEEPIWAVQCIYESVARYIASKEGVLLKGKQGLKGLKLASRINSSPLMQLECSRELRDLEELSRGYSPELALLLRARAEAEPSLPAELIVPSDLPSLSLVQIMHLQDGEFCV
ncbi:MAG: hypothetical protein HY986_07470 [Candidatus Melainabacteria bacterium]|nr:hypothetical protein [Candidatus Melainabacteria bacterium]